MSMVAKICVADGFPMSSYFIINKIYALDQREMWSLFIGWRDLFSNASKRRVQNNKVLRHYIFSSAILFDFHVVASEHFYVWCLVLSKNKMDVGSAAHIKVTVTNLLLVANFQKFLDKPSQAEGKIYFQIFYRHTNREFFLYSEK